MSKRRKRNWPVRAGRVRVDNKARLEAKKQKKSRLRRRLRNSTTVEVTASPQSKSPSSSKSTGSRSTRRKVLHRNSLTENTSARASNPSSSTSFKQLTAPCKKLEML